MTRHERLATLVATVAASALLAGPQASAQHYPDRPIMIVHNYGPGTASDATARMIAEALSQQLGKPTVVDNKSGAAGVVGERPVAEGEPLVAARWGRALEDAAAEAEVGLARGVLWEEGALNPAEAVADSLPGVHPALVLPPSEGRLLPVAEGQGQWGFEERSVGRGDNISDWCRR